MIGQTISHYRILEKIGEGGMGVVYKAEDTNLKRLAALKFLPPDMTRDPAAKERFLHEARAAAALNHPNIVTIHEINEHEGQVYIVMEYVEGRSLKDIISGGPAPATLKQMPISQALDITIQIARGLAAAHAKGIVHRDIKPANIFITNESVVKILDFGIAKLAGGETKLTKTGTTMGTAAYMSPEQTTGKEVDQRTDIWSLGVILYEMLSGETPFKGEYMQAVVYAILNEEPKPLSNTRSDILPGLDLVVAKALAKNPKDRYQSMNDLAANLKTAAEGTQPIKARAKGFWANIFSKKIFYLSAAAAALALLLALDIGGIRGQLFGPKGSAPGIVRLAVLPFANLSGDPQQEYFSDGLTQEMISQLGKLHPQSLSVIARTSVMRYKNSNTPIDQIGHELGVEYVLEGSARREGSRVKVTAELIQVKGQSQLWADTYEREMSGILVLQSDLAGKVAGALAIRLLPSEKAKLAEARPVNPEAHEAYLQGFFHWMKMTPGDLDIAEKYFDLSLEKDPSYAPAYVGRAFIWVVRNQFGLAPPEQAGPKAKAAALRAIELDENLAGAHEALATVRTWIDWDWDGARESWRRTLELNPNVANAQALYSHFLMIMGHGEEALNHSERAVVLDPFNPLVHSFHAFVLYWQRRHDEAISAAREALRIQPGFPLATNALWWIMHELKGMEKETLEAAKACDRVIYNDPKIDAALDEGYAQGGYAEAMKRAAEALIARLPKAYSMPSDIAIFYAMAGEKDKALDWLEKGFEVRDPALPYLGYPCFDILRPDPRFQDLVLRMKLPMSEKK
jgi:TolB-like protein/Tfp pilus assembly protein PilF/predicted Ser/Thr protein kinase